MVAENNLLRPVAAAPKRSRMGDLMSGFFLKFKCREVDRPG
jgi:hypothetical protein